MPRWTVRDVMTTDVVSVTADSLYKAIVGALAQHSVGAVPVVDNPGRVLLLQRRQRRVAHHHFMGVTVKETTP
jgi:CBS-domain-containing membrane protein